MNSFLRDILDRSIRDIRDGVADSGAASILCDLLKRFQQERAGFAGGFIDSQVLELHGPEVHALRIDEQDINEVLAAVIEASRELPAPSRLVAAVLARPETESAIPLVLEELERWRPPFAAPWHDNVTAAMLIGSVSAFADRPDVRAALEAFVGSGGYAAEEAEYLLAHYRPM